MKNLLLVILLFTSLGSSNEVFAVEDEMIEVKYEPYNGTDSEIKRILIIPGEHLIYRSPNASEIKKLQTDIENLAKEINSDPSLKGKFEFKDVSTFTKTMTLTLLVNKKYVKSEKLKTSWVRFDEYVLTFNRTLSSAVFRALDSRLKDFGYDLQSSDGNRVSYAITFATTNSGRARYSGHYEGAEKIVINPFGRKFDLGKEFNAKYDPSEVGAPLFCSRGTESNITECQISVMKQKTSN